MSLRDQHPVDPSHPQRIAIIGAGNVGGTLGGRFASLGHEVTFGVREGREAKSDAARSAGARVAPPRAAVEGADVVLLAVPARTIADVLREVGAADGALDGKVVIDTTNSFGPGMTLLVGPNGESGAEQLQAQIPRARVVKAFNTTGYGNMANPVYGDRASVMFVAGDDAAARAVALELARAIGFDAVDAGSLVRARELEHLAALWVALSIAGHGREIAFALLRR